MLQIESELEGKQAEFGFLKNKVKEHGFSLGGYWDYDKGFFDTILSKEEGESIYLRLPFTVVTGMLDNNNARIKFQTPLLVKHIVHLGIEHDGSSLMDASGLSQFQTPIDQDAPIEDGNKWINEGKKVVDQVLQYLN